MLWSVAVVNLMLKRTYENVLKPIEITQRHTVHEVMNEVSAPIVENRQRDRVLDNDRRGRKRSAWITEHARQSFFYLKGKVEPENEIQTDEEYFEERDEKEQTLIYHCRMAKPNYSVKYIGDKSALPVCSPENKKRGQGDSRLPPSPGS